MRREEMVGEERREMEMEEPGVEIRGGEMGRRASEERMENTLQYISNNAAHRQGK